MTNPCKLGLKCPYLGYDAEDGEMFCAYPVLIKDVKEDEYYPLSDECDCGICDYDTELNEVILAYTYYDYVKDAVKRAVVEMDAESERIRAEIEERRRAREGVSQ